MLLFFTAISLLLVFVIACARFGSSRPNLISRLFPRMFARSQNGDSKGRQLDTLTALLRAGDRAAAVRLCEQLEREGEMTPAIVATVRGDTGQPLEEILAMLERVQNPLHEDQEIGELIGECRFGTAAEVLQARLKQQPENFTLFMCYLQLLAVYCANSTGAAVAIRKRSRVRGFSAQEYEELKRNLQQWGKHDVLVA